MNTCVRFKGDFSKAESEREVAGRELADFLASRLPQKGCLIDGVESDEISFTVKARSGNIDYPLMICLNFEDKKHWEIICPRRKGFFSREFGVGYEAELGELVQAIDEILRSDERISDVKWFEDYGELHGSYDTAKSSKFVNILWKYHEKSLKPLFTAVVVLFLVGAIVRKDWVFDIIMVLLAWLIGGLFVIGILSLLSRYIEIVVVTFRKGGKKNWRKLIVSSVILVLLVGGFLMGYLLRKTR
jgi:hypothetical protein